MFEVCPSGGTEVCSDPSGSRRSDETSAAGTRASQCMYWLRLLFFCCGWWWWRSHIKTCLIPLNKSRCWMTRWLTVFSVGCHQGYSTKARLGFRRSKTSKEQINDAAFEPATHTAIKSQFCLLYTLGLIYQSSVFVCYTGVCTAMFTLIAWNRRYRQVIENTSANGCKKKITTWPYRSQMYLIQMFL